MLTIILDTVAASIAAPVMLVLCAQTARVKSAV